MANTPLDMRLARMRRAEYASVAEVVARYVMITLATAALFLSQMDVTYLLWFVTYIGAEAFLAALLFDRLPVKRRLQWSMALLFYNINALLFGLLPVFLIASFEPAQVVFGVVALIGLLIYTMQSPDPDRAIRLSYMGQFCALMLAVVMVVLPHMQTPSEIVMVLFAAASLTLYFCLAVANQRRMLSELDDVRDRYARSQKARALTQFVGGVAHDFNNLLTVISGNLELHDTLDTPAEKTAALQDARAAAGRAAVTVRQLLATSGRARLRPQTQDEAQLFDTLVPLLGQVLEPGIKVQAQPGAAALQFRVDPDMLETMVVQLCLNAQDAMGGKGVIALRGTRTEEIIPAPILPPEAQPPYFALTIADSGPGVDPGMLSMLSEPFYTTKPVGAGPGLGLSAVQGFARQSGGALGLSNRASGGLAVTIFLPAQDMGTEGQEPVSGS